MAQRTRPAHIRRSQLHQPLPAHPTSLHDPHCLPRFIQLTPYLVGLDSRDTPIERRQISDTRRVKQSNELGLVSLTLVDERKERDHEPPTQELRPHCGLVSCQPAGAASPCTICAGTGGSGPADDSGALDTPVGAITFSEFALGTHISNQCADRGIVLAETIHTSRST